MISTEIGPDGVQRGKIILLGDEKKKKNENENKERIKKKKKQEMMKIII